MKLALKNPFLVDLNFDQLCSILWRPKNVRESRVTRTGDQLNSDPSPYTECYLAQLFTKTDSFNSIMNGLLSFSNKSCSDSGKLSDSARARQNRAVLLQRLERLVRHEAHQSQVPESGNGQLDGDVHHRLPELHNVQRKSCSKPEVRRRQFAISGFGFHDRAVWSRLCRN